MAKNSKTPSAKVSAKGIPVVVVGSKGCAVFPALFSADGFVIPTESCHGKAAVFPAINAKADGKPSMVSWKGKSDGSAAGKAARAWVSKSGESVAYFKLAEALKTGAVVALKARIDGESTEVVYAPKGRQSERLQYWGTDRPGGRLETSTLDKRAIGRADSVRFGASVVPIPPVPAKAIASPAKAK